MVATLQMQADDECQKTRAAQRSIFQRWRAALTDVKVSSQYPCNLHLAGERH